MTLPGAKRAPNHGGVGHNRLCGNWLSCTHTLMQVPSVKEWLGSYSWCLASLTHLTQKSIMPVSSMTPGVRVAADVNETSTPLLYGVNDGKRAITCLFYGIREAARCRV